MRLMDWFSTGMLLGAAVCFGCADNRRDHGDTTQAAASAERREESSASKGEPVAGAGAPTASPSSQDGPHPVSPRTLPFIAEAKSPFTVIDLLSPGRLEIVDGCVTVAVQGKERATAVFPPGVKPELKGDVVVAVSFGGRTIPLGQQVPIPGGFVDLSSADLVQPIPSNCPKKLFGL
jgi:uncharacterized Zn-binding protein involved in type VI secretion